MYLHICIPASFDALMHRPLTWSSWLENVKTMTLKELRVELAVHGLTDQNGQKGMRRIVLLRQRLLQAIILKKDMYKKLLFPDRPHWSSSPPPPLLFQNRHTHVHCATLLLPVTWPMVAGAQLCNVISTLRLSPISKFRSTMTELGISTKTVSRGECVS